MGNDQIFVPVDTDLKTRIEKNAKTLGLQTATFLRLATIEKMQKMEQVQA